MSETTYEGFEAVEPETPFERKRYRFNYVCERCGHKWHKTAYAAPKRDPKCPNPSCVEVSKVAELERQVANLTQMLSEQRAPGHIGANNTVKAIDTTAEIVMQDYGMTNLQDGIRAGEPVAQKLPPQQQAAADAYFGGHKDAKVPDFGTNRVRTVRAKQMQMLGQRAIAGSYAKMAVGPTAVVPNAVRGSSPLTRVRVEDNSGFRGPRRG